MPTLSTENIATSKIDQFLSKNSNIYTHLILNYEDPGLHRHEFIEFFYVLGGQSYHILDGTIQKITCGDAFLLTPQNYHTFKNLGDTFLHRDIIFKTDYFKRVCAMYSDELFANFEKNYSKKIKLSTEQLNQLESIVQPVSLSLDCKDDIYASTVCTFIINAFLEHSLDFKVNYPVWIARLLSLLSEPQNFTTDQQILVGSLPFSKEYICRTFKKLIGKNVTDYFNEQKMKYAYSLLKAAPYSVEKICEMINFNNASYFYRLFKKTFGITPKEVQNPK